MTTVSSFRLFGCTIYLALVGLFAMLATLWALGNVTDGRSLLWITWLSVLGAFVALPTSIVVIRRCAGVPLPR